MYINEISGDFILTGYTVFERLKQAAKSEMDEICRALRIEKIGDPGLNKTNVSIV